MPSLQQFRGADHTTSSAPCRNAASNGVAWFLLGCLVFLYLSRFTLPDTPIYRIGDELIYLENAVKMFDGQTLYRDFFQFTPPGTEFLYFSLFKLVGIRAWVPGVILLLLGMGFAWLSVAITQRFISGVDVFLPGLLFLTCAYYWWLDCTHHCFSGLCVMAAVMVVLERRGLQR